MAKTLVIVESPTKAKTLKKYLGNSFDIQFSMGHIRDLPQKELGIDIERDFEPEYIIPDDKNKVVQNLIDAAKHADRIYLAPDPDREGEAIAFHLYYILHKALPDKDIKRILFNEISPSAVQNAIKNPLDIDSSKVNAQQTRRILDRLVGYKISPFLWRTLYSGLSAGRVQTVALRLLIEREEEIRGFKIEEYWSISAKFLTSKDKEFISELYKIDDKGFKIRDKVITDKHIEEIKKQRYSVLSYEEKEVKKSPLPPFITSTLQQEASKRMGFSSSKTMKVAQQLYEGVELGSEGSTALITYMRTDSTRISVDSIRKTREYIHSSLPPEYLPVKALQYIPKKSSQDAHEAIRPIDPFKTPDSVKKFLSKDQLRLYSLIWTRYIACQMSPAVRNQVTLRVKGGIYEFLTSGSVLLFDGFQRIYPPQSSSDTSPPPKLNKGDIVKLKQIKGEQHFTEPPPSYTEASLIKELEDKGIGRPSTYASIITTLKERQYIEIKIKKFLPSDLGEKVWMVLKKYFPSTFEIDFTAHMETELDQIILGKQTRSQVLNEFYNLFKDTLKSAFNNTKEAKKMLVEDSEEKCPICGAPMLVRLSRFGKFLACSKYPKCTGKMNIVIKKETPKETEFKCPNCSKPMVIRKGKYGEFLACSAYPECKTTMSIPTGVKCPQSSCGGELIMQGKGAICNNKNCAYKVPYRPLLEECPKCGFSFLLDRITKSEGRHKYCLRCKFKEEVKEEIQE